jgi:hypothetical protein
MTEEDLSELKRRAGLGAFCNSTDFEELFLDLRAGIASDVFENLLCLIYSANGSEVSWRVGKKFDTGKEEKCREALEGEKKSPSDC